MVSTKQNQNNLLAKKKKGLAIVIFIVIISTILITLALFFSYSSFLYKTLLNERQNLIKESSTQTIKQARSLLQVQESVLTSIANMTRKNFISNEVQLTNFLSSEKERWIFNELALIDTEKQFHNADGTITKKPEIPGSVEPNYYFTNENFFYSIIDVPNYNVLNYTVDKIYAKISMNNVSVKIMPIFSQKTGISFLIDEYGYFLQNAEKSKLSDSPENFLEFLMDAKIENGYSLEELKKDLFEGKPKFLSFYKNNKEYYLYFSPVGINQWRLVNLIEVAALSEKTNLLFLLTATISLSIAFLFSIFLMGYLITAYKNKKTLEKIAYTDTLTGAPNQLKFEKKAEYYLQQTDNQYLIAYSNIRKFKYFNERYGKEAGDYILIKLKEIFEAEIQENECFARLSSDNFALLLIYKTPEELDKRLKYLAEISSKIHTEKNIHFNVELSFGIYFPKNRQGKIISMLDKAHLALKMMIRKKIYNVYDDKIKQQMIREKSLEDKMVKALAENQFEVYFQPKVDLQTSKIVGAEALIRWNEPEEGLLFPNDFIPLFERNGFIVSIDMYVFETICSKIRVWLDKGWEVPTISFNLSKSNIEVPNFLEIYKNILNHYDIPRKYIEFEFTETMVYENVSILKTIIDKIHEMGCSCSMDDFGSGYSSLNMLKDVNVDVLKLDKAFFDMVPTLDERGKTVVNSVISLAKDLNLKTISEGIETLEQVKFLQKAGCDYVQGFYFSKPLPIHLFEEKVFGVSLNK